MREVGLYIHIPFCRSKCPYCDFTSTTNIEPIKDYLEALTLELKGYLGRIYIDTLYFGGGTPSLLNLRDLERILNFLYKNFRGSFREITLEMNPEDYNFEEIRGLYDLGINRVSLGVQSFREEGLRFLGRGHDLKLVFKKLNYLLRVPFSSVNIDLIYGYQSLGELKEELKVLRGIEVNHVSFYLLTPYEGTPFEGLKLSEDLIHREHLLISETMKELGFERYEVSNWAKDGKYCLHNLKYWLLEEYVGVGVSSASFFEGLRYKNTNSLREYLKKVKEGKSPVAFEERPDLKRERIILGLRTKFGVEKKLLKLPESLKVFFKEEGNRISLKEEHYLLLNEILTELI